MKTRVDLSEQIREFEESLNCIKAVGELTDEELQLVRVKILELSRTSVFTVQQVSDRFKLMTMKGTKINDILDHGWKLTVGYFY